ncbi:uncharacterized protein LOC130773207 [Actinidia eriantha]|uniref:uncharacterized protein LOC130773207 n=1 Tax=Actinidia eriantha TaxID=165200 RepID=UPI002590C889|nr:uncharacterized protein LOC130773207 [Actinidia eriantha]
MAIVLRFVDVHGFLRECFFEIVHVTNTTAFTLKKEIFDVLTRYNLNIENMQGQGLIDMYGATIKVLQTMVKEGSSNSIHEEAGSALIVVRSFDFIFILHLMHRIMGITDLLCRALQHKSLDILNAMDLVSTIKALLQTLRQDSFNTLLMHVGSVCIQYDIEMPIMDARYTEFIGRSCQQRNHITMEHHYRVDIFNAIIDF